MVSDNGMVMVWGRYGYGIKKFLCSFVVQLHASLFVILLALGKALRESAALLSSTSHRKPISAFPLFANAAISRFAFTAGTYSGNDQLVTWC